MLHFSDSFQSVKKSSTAASYASTTQLTECSLDQHSPEYLKVVHIGPEILVKKLIKCITI